MPEKQQPTAPAAMTAERLKSEFADVHAEILAGGAQAERERFGALKEACGDDTELLVQCFAEGVTETEALKRRNERLARQLAEASKQSATSTSQTPADPAIAEFKEQVPGQSSVDDEEPTDFSAAVQAYMKDHGISEAEAVDKCVDLYPKLHARMTQGGA